MQAESLDDLDTRRRQAEREVVIMQDEGLHEQRPSPYKYKHAVLLWLCAEQKYQFAERDRQQGWK